MEGWRCPTTTLYMINLTKQKPSIMTEETLPEAHFANNVYEYKSKQNLVDYLHTSNWSPTISG